MSGSDKEQASSVDEVEYETSSDEEPQEQPVPPASKSKSQRKTQQRSRKNQAQDLPVSNPAMNQQMVPAQDQQLTGNMGGSTGAIRQSRIKDRPKPNVERDSSLKIKIELDLEVEVDLYARVKGDITIGLL